MIVEALSHVVAIQPSGMFPGRHVKEAVIAEWHRLHNDTVENKIAAGPRIKKITAVLAVAASVITAVSSYIIFNTIKADNLYPLLVTSFTGEVILNDSAASVYSTFKTGDIIITENKSSAVVSAKDYNLYVGRSSILKVNGNDKKNGIYFNLNEGSVISKSSGSMNYRFDCGEYKIIPAGTEFLLQYSRHKLAAAVLQGIIVVTGPGLRMDIPSGTKWSSENPGSLEKLDAETSALINSVPSGIWPADTTSSDNGVKTSAVKTASKEAPEDKSVKDKKEKKEKIKLTRELRDEMKEIKREQRKEQKKEQKGRNM